jgi:crotonobetainyl-CoA:carnitine CoA-transferase CaiB-like acyl-CoA transferase
VAPVLTVAEVAEDPHLSARGVFGEAEHPERGRFRQVAPVIAGSERRDTYAVPSRESSDQVLADAGLTADEIEALRNKGVVA